MPPRFLSTGLALLIDSLVITVACAFLALTYWIASGAGGSYLATFSNVLFFAGGIILTFGALVELFHLKQTRDIRRMLLRSANIIKRTHVRETADSDIDDDELNTGWLLILIGALLIIFSLLASFDYLI
jgi:hypothetical protein